MQLQPKGLSLCAVSIFKMTFRGSTLRWQWWWWGFEPSGRLETFWILFWPPMTAWVSFHSIKHTF